MDNFDEVDAAIAALSSAFAEAAHAQPLAVVVAASVLFLDASLEQVAQRETNRAYQASLSLASEMLAARTNPNNTIN